MNQETHLDKKTQEEESLYLKHKANSLKECIANRDMCEVCESYYLKGLPQFWFIQDGEKICKYCFRGRKKKFKLYQSF